MAWPCITRACCINRFWTELDKGDISVPLVFTKYSDVADLQHMPHHPQPKQRAGAIAIETQSHPGEQEAGKAPPATGAAAGKDGSSASVMRQDFKAWRVRPEPSCKPRNEYHPSATPFNNETQYQKDYKPWPISKKHDHPWIPKPSPTAAAAAATERSAASGKPEPAAEAESGVEKSEIEEKLQEKESKDAAMRSARREKSAERKPAEKSEAEVSAEVSAEQRKGRAAADALNRQIKEVMSTSSSYRTEFKAYKDVKPVKAIKAASQYKPPVVETSRETSYSATYKGEQVKAQPTDNKLLDRRRIRSLYNEPSKEPAKANKPVSRTKPKKTPTTTTGKMVKKAKEKQIAGSQSAKKKPSVGAAEPKPEGVVTKKSKEISNRLAEAKQ
ncbi:microtubule-associated protein 6 homolog isoform X1 [Hippoglossus hippoglossus]|uniref:microtubule-associated protein 6 homolog isoform X1 n=1 Tax=Hippoglossus hippoglossus TaxID=8267 RepID=UPI00148E7609|nr:microtubule-associated protein 6 homolog isoform X1 [Hippoglossus hippoglossus]